MSLSQENEWPSLSEKSKIDTILNAQESALCSFQVCLCVCVCVCVFPTYISLSQWVTVSESVTIIFFDRPHDDGVCTKNDQNGPKITTSSS